jgi:lysyl-tRNA synthetase class 2
MADANLKNQSLDSKAPEENTKATANEREDRLKKLVELYEAGLNPYPAKVERDFTISEVLADFDNLAKAEKKFHIVGRLRAKREHGNLAFANLEDASGNIQLAFSKKELGPDNYKKFLKLIDVADFLEIYGGVFLTHKGEKSLMVADFKIISKALRPIPDAWYGLKDEEERLRKRYLDLLLNPELRDLFYQKARFWETARAFMKRHGFFEVETPTLETTTGGAEANPFKTHHDDFDLPVYLRISVGELWQKRLMAAGYEKVFEIGRVYRNEGSSLDHLQEFTNLEFYWAYADYEKGMELVRELYQEIAQQVFGKTNFTTKGFSYDLGGQWPKIDYREEVLKQTGIDVLGATESEMKIKLEELKVKYVGDNRERLMDTLWKYCRKNIAGPAFLINHPKLVSPLAKAKSDNPELTERFQVIIAGSEIGNGFSELNDPVDQAKRFKLQQELIDRGDKEAMMPDWEFVEMLEHGMPPTCGFGFGERLFAFLVDKPVRETTLFPLMKPKLEE